MNNILSYIPSIFCIRNDKFVPFRTSGAVPTNLLACHKNILTYCFDKGLQAAMIFENELSMLRDLEDINNNEIKTFLQSNTDWDMLIIGVNEITDCSPVKGYSRISVLNNTNKFITSYVYIASRRLMDKIKRNDRSEVKTYVYSPSFLTNMKDVDSSSLKAYLFGEVTNINIANTEKVSYNWHAISV